MTRGRKKTAETTVEPRRRGRPKKVAEEVAFIDGLGGTETIEDVAVDDIDLADRRFQYRVREKLTDLKPSLTGEGQLVPVILWGGKPPYKIIDGYRRVAAIKEIGWKIVKAIIRKDITEDDAYRISFIENVKRKNFSPIDMAHAVWKMRERGKTNDQLAAEFNLSASQIKRYKMLLSFAPVVKEALENKEISMAHAHVFHTLGIDDLEPYRERLAGGISAQALKRLIQKTIGIKRTPRQYFRKEKDGFRLFPMRFNARMSKKERDKIIAILERALSLAKQAE
ncbi:ParB/RepB/Spo0J family partition protein [bacterium]|nr:ParB/RepB/Spo0J family partition protein [candidate division CSSED10-310 bacterium]